MGGIGFSMDTGPALYFLTNILKYRLNRQLNCTQSLYDSACYTSTKAPKQLKSQRTHIKTREKTESLETRRYTLDHERRPRDPRKNINISE